MVGVVLQTVWSLISLWFQSQTTPTLTESSLPPLIYQSRALAHGTVKNLPQTLAAVLMFSSLHSNKAITRLSHVPLTIHFGVLKVSVPGILRASSFHCCLP